MKDLEEWANDSAAFQDLNEKYDLTKTLSEQTSQIPGELGNAAHGARGRSRSASSRTWSRR